jgi:hypothetical protein
MIYKVSHTPFLAPAMTRPSWRAVSQLTVGFISGRAYHQTGWHTFSSHFFPCSTFWQPGDPSSQKKKSCCLLLPPSPPRLVDGLPALDT